MSENGGQKRGCCFHSHHFSVLFTRFSIQPTAGQRRANGGANDGNNYSDAGLGSYSGRIDRRQSRARLQRPAVDAPGGTLSRTLGYRACGRQTRCSGLASQIRQPAREASLGSGGCAHKVIWAHASDHHFDHSRWKPAPKRGPSDQPTMLRKFFVGEIVVGRSLRGARLSDGASHITVAKVTVNV